MKERTGLLDTGPLVSFLAADLEHHVWAVQQWKNLRPPLLTCEPVLTEAAFLLKRQGRNADALFAMLETRGYPDRDLRGAGAGGSPGPDAALLQSADVVGRCLHGSLV